ncbi:hypothetical protein LWC33_14220 [Pseudonocardia sp. RS11V-5]|uniref:HlyD family efflux transporter periplasmic adaptor subunit n=1 Tax=Pseudonocardia terrae TaxID=2905831 RepID=UPI001E54ED4E|nr:HlyD family efflux transporter periplasmic adaptor subunit [Pseudonocardia terrae]MCE3552609.1 hypothetical protein [Pseudonocardia terrae]
MSWRGRIRLGVGLLGVVVLTAVLTMVLNARNGVVDSRSAALAAETYPVGTDYGGTLVTQLVHIGDQVAVGQPMFELRSGAVQRDVAQRLVDTSALPYEMRADGTLVLTASDAGRVASLAYPLGSFVPANSTIATVQRAGSLYIEGEFVLTAQDYARLAPDATVEVLLPSNRSVDAKVRRIQVQTEDGQARTEVEAYSDQLADATADGLFAVGTPVTATLHLRNDGLVTDATAWVLRKVGGVSDAAATVLRQIGLDP